MSRIKDITKDISRQRQVEKEFASKAEEDVVTKPFKDRQAIHIDID